MNRIEKVRVLLSIPMIVALFIEGLYEENSFLMAECIGLLIIAFCYLLPMKDILRRFVVFLSSVKVNRKSVYKRTA
ncbi:hypothetical protein [Butyrivibrio sp. JL13D10]|uniref:hypothetical protein n=1 Tax=Butyrivibrio sp. JL13D10 TaxID=3236815 RepID=UPI0038B58BB2